MRAEVRALALAAAVLSLAGSATAQRLDRLGCVLYSRADDAYACVDFALVSDDAGGRDPSRMPDVARWVQRGDAAWGGHRGIALVTGDSNDEGERTLFAVAERTYAVRARIRRPSTLRAALARAHALGYTVPVDARAELTSGRWIAFAGVHLRFETELHEGDASAYAIGSVYARCTAPSPSDGVEGSHELLGRGIERRGDRAIVFHARGAPSIAISLREADGAEGARGVRTRTLVVRLADVCGGR